MEKTSAQLCTNGIFFFFTYCYLYLYHKALLGINSCQIYLTWRFKECFSGQLNCIQRFPIWHEPSECCKMDSTQACQERQTEDNWDGSPTSEAQNDIRRRWGRRIEHRCGELQWKERKPPENAWEFKLETTKKQAEVAVLMHRR